MIIMYRPPTRSVNPEDIAKQRANREQTDKKVRERRARYNKVVEDLARTTMEYYNGNALLADNDLKIAIEHSEVQGLIRTLVLQGIVNEELLYGEILKVAEEMTENLKAQIKNSRQTARTETETSDKH